MRVLAIETSCDESAVCLLSINTSATKTRISILGNALHSQIKLHEQYGGVFPMVAKREHARVLTHLLKLVLKEADSPVSRKRESVSASLQQNVKKLLEREDGLAQELLSFISEFKKPKIDCIAVTNGPGLEPALWVGVNFAKALSLLWDIPVLPINHMEGHLLSSLATVKEGQLEIKKTKLPLLGLLISGGHTELVLMKKFGSYKILGQTRDDAVGEAFDKVARMLGLPYPGGPEISKLAEHARQRNIRGDIALPRPMLHSDNFDFSFAGLKTAVLYALKKIESINDDVRMKFALEFENAATEVLTAKVRAALNASKALSFTIGGGVSANKHIRTQMQALCENEFPEVTFLPPTKSLTTDNAVMIGITAAYKFKTHKRYSKTFKANGNLSLQKQKGK